MAIIDLNPARNGLQAPTPAMQPLENPVARAVSQLGDTIAALEQRTRAVRNQREGMEAGAEYAEGLAEMRARADRNDPEFAADPVAAWRAGADRLRAEIGQRLSDRNARADFDARSRATAAGELPAVYAIAGRREADRTNAALADTMGRLARGASAETDPVIRARRIQEADDAIAGALAEGAITAVQAQRFGQTFRGGLDQGDALRLINQNPAEAVRALSDARRFQNLDDVARERLFSTATARAAAAEARAEAAMARRERRVAQEVSEFGSLLAAGVVPEDRAARVLELARGTDLEPRVRQMIADGRAISSFTLASDAQQRELLAAADARRRSGNATDADQAQYVRLVQARQAQMTAYQQDGLGRAVAEGLIAPLPPINWSDPASLDARVEAAATVSARRGYGVSPFNREDLAAGVEAFTRGTPEAKLAVVQSVAAISDPQVRAAAIQHLERARGDAGRLPPGTLARVADMIRTGTVESTMAARRLIGDLTADVSERARQAGESAEMRAALVTAQASGVQAVRVRQAELAGGGPYAAVVSRDMDVIQRAAAARMASGEASATRAVEAAASTFNAGLAVVDDSSLGHVYFPASAGTPAQMAAGLRLLRDQAAAVNADPALGADQAQGAIARREAARRAIWINEGGTFALVARGQAGATVVLRTVTLSEVARAAEGQAARDLARPPVMRREDTLEQSRRDMRAPAPQPDRPQRPPALQ